MLLVSHHPLAAQGTITVAAGVGPTVLVAPGGKVTVPVDVNMTAAAGGNLASLSTALAWTASQLTLDSAKALFGTATINIQSGSAQLALFNATGTTNTATVVNLFFTAAATAGASRVQVVPLSAGDELGADILPALRARNLDVCVAPLGRWGDVNADDVANIIDAQQIARYSVGLAVGNPTAVAAQGDVTGDGPVNIIDAQQIARFSVALPAAARIATVLALVPPVSSMSVSPGTVAVGVGQATQLFASPMDGSGTLLFGCQPVTWGSTDLAKATVSADGMVTGVGAGAVTISATAGGKTGAASLTIADPVTTIALAPDTATITMGAQVQIVATPRDAASNPLAGRAITYTSSDPAIATVSGTGLVSSITAGLVSITATSEQKSSVASIQVAPLPVNSLTAGDNFVCALTVKGEAFCWGGNAAGQLGDGSANASNVPVRVSTSEPLTFTQISATGTRVCAVTNRQRLYCWGQYGIGGVPSSAIPVLMSGTLQVKSVANGNSHACALDIAGAAYCWGRNTNGKLGTGDTVSSIVPRLVSGGLALQSLTAGLFGTCGRQTNGTAYCWGDNSLRTLGITGAPANALVPTAVSGGLFFNSLITGGTLSCGIVAGGAAYCWGTSYYGSSGAGTTAGGQQVAPTAVSGGIAFSSIAPGVGNNIFDGICGLATDASAYCWGANNSGQLGTSTPPAGTCTQGASTFACTATPVAVTTASKFNVISVGSDNVCGITTTRALLCWGKNDVGQLGDGTNTNQSTPVTVSGALRLP